MKIVFSSTDEQEQEIEKALHNLRSVVLPRYIPNRDLEQYNAIGLLQFSTHGGKYNGTLKEAYQLMTSLHTITSIIAYINSAVEEEKSQYELLFMRNVEILNDLGLLFPFTFNCFSQGISTNDCAVDLEIQH
ncbi:MAG: DUF5365 family protein [Bacillus sp. (in: firmicutes)]